MLHLSVLPTTSEFWRSGKILPNGFPAFALSGSLLGFDMLITLFFGLNCLAPSFLSVELPRDGCEVNDHE